MVVVCSFFLSLENFPLIMSHGSITLEQNFWTLSLSLSHPYVCFSCAELQVDSIATTCATVENWFHIQATKG